MELSFAWESLPENVTRLIRQAKLLIVPGTMIPGTIIGTTIGTMTYDNIKITGVIHKGWLGACEEE